MTRSPVALVAATLAVVSTAAPAVAQPDAEAEFEIGGGYHKAFNLPAFIEFPSVGAVDARVTNWLSDRWGVAVRAAVAFGGHDDGDIEHRYPTYVHVLARYRTVGPGEIDLHFGIGGGLYGFQEIESLELLSFEMESPEEIERVIQKIERFRVFPHVLALEALGSKSLTDRLSIRFGVTMAVLIQVTPTVLLAWEF